MYRLQTVRVGTVSQHDTLKLKLSAVMLNMQIKYHPLLLHKDLQIRHSFK